MRALVIVVVIVLGACFSKPEQSFALQDAVPGDGALADGGPDAPPDALACAAFGPWSTPMILPGINAPLFHDEMAALSPDGSLLVFSSGRSNFGDLYVTRLDPAMETVPTAVFVTSAEESDPAWSADGTKLYFKRNSQFMVSAVDTTIDPPFQPPTVAIDLNPLVPITRPRFSPDGLEVFFSRTNPQEILRSRRAPAGSWGAPTVVSEIVATNPAWQADPIVSGDGRTLYFVTNRISGGSLYLFQTTRPDLTSPFDALGEVPELNTVPMRHPELSRDGRTLVFSRYITEGDLFFSQRSCE